MSLPQFYLSPLFLTTIASAMVWTVFHMIVNDRVLMSLLPSEARTKVAQKKLRDSKVFAKTCRSNGTAFNHACITVPLALYCALGSQTLWDNPWHGHSTVLEVTGGIMSGYFLWDTIVCLLHFDLYGWAFLLHAVMCFVGLYVQLASTTIRAEWFIAVFMATEISTPLLHYRWFLIQGGMTKCWHFVFANFGFFLTFVGYRLVVAPVFTFYPFLREALNFHAAMPMSTLRRLLQCVISFLWLGLNYYWGILLVMSQAKQLFSGKSRKVAEVADSETKKVQ